MATRETVNQVSANASNASKTSRYRPEIDGLRAFAVVAVIINHFNKDILPGGYLGVDIFFVISGYVITSSLFGRPSKDFKDFISGFYERRIKRLVPALSVFVLITSISICLFNPSPGLSLRTGLRSLFGLSNLYLLKQSTDYFAQSTELNVFTHTWSLGVEEQFYILFPFLIWFSGFGRQTKNGARNLFLAVGALTIASLIGFLYLYPTNQPAAYFLMPSRFWEMAAGCLIFIGFQKRASVEQLLEKVPPLLVMALIVGVMYLPMSLAAASTIAVVALSSILIASLKKQTAAFKVFTNPKVVYIGLISYSLYLWHWGVLSISRWTIGIHWWSVPFQVALMLGIAIASYRWIETPLRKGNWFGKRWKTLVVGGGVLVTVSSGLVALGKPLKGKLFTGSDGTLDAATWGRSNAKTDLNFTGKRCHIGDNEFKIEWINECTIGTPNSSQKFFLVGNSHANHYLETFYLISKNNDVDVQGLTISWCPFPYSERFTKKCKTKSQLHIEKFIHDNARPGDVVFISNRRLVNPERNRKDLDGYDWMTGDQFLEDISEFIFSIPKGVKVVLILPTPEFDTPPELCEPQWFRPYTSKSCSKVNPYSEIPILAPLKQMNNDILLFNPSHEICPDNDCKMFNDEQHRIFIDKNHLSDYSNNRYIYPSLVEFARKNQLLTNPIAN